MNSTYLASWLLIYLNRLHGLFVQNDITENEFQVLVLTVENTLGLLQNISLKTVGIDKIIQL
jgi:hypothetical protein